jgi:hypothetical protein
MKLAAITLLRTHIDQIANEIKDNVMQQYPNRTNFFDKCSRDLKYILTAIANCIDENSFSSLDHVIRQFFRGGELQLKEIEVELWAYNIAETRILDLFKSNNITIELQNIVSDSFKTLKYHLEHGYADIHYPDNDWTSILQNKKQTVSWNDKTPDIRVVESIINEVHQHCNSKQNRVPVEIMIMDQSHTQHREMLFNHAKDQNSKHYNTQLLAPYVILLFIRDVPTLSHNEIVKSGHLECGLISQFIAFSAVSKGLSIGFCKCFDDDHRKKFKKLFKRETPALALGLGYYKDKAFETDPWKNKKYNAAVSSSSGSNPYNNHVKPPQHEYITYMIDKTIR